MLPFVVRIALQPPNNVKPPNTKPPFVRFSLQLKELPLRSNLHVVRVALTTEHENPVRPVLTPI